MAIALQFCLFKKSPILSRDLNPKLRATYLFLRHCCYPPSRGGRRGTEEGDFGLPLARSDASAASEAPVRPQHHSWWFRARIRR